MKIAGYIQDSIVDGPGIRFTLFLQGCNLQCKNCHNPETWDLNAGQEIEIKSIINLIKENPLLDGITLSGGEPFLQWEECLKLLIELNDSNLNIWVYTGYNFEDLLNNPIYYEFLKRINVLVDGSFDDNKKSLSLKWKGSSNQRLIDVQKSLDKNKTILYEI